MSATAFAEALADYGYALAESQRALTTFAVAHSIEETAKAHRKMAAEGMARANAARDAAHDILTEIHPG